MDALGFTNKPLAAAGQFCDFFEKMNKWINNTMRKTHDFELQYLRKLPLL